MFYTRDTAPNHHQNQPKHLPSNHDGKPTTMRARAVIAAAILAAAPLTITTTANAAPNPRGGCDIDGIPAGFPNCRTAGVPEWANLNTGTINGDVVIKSGDNTRISNKVINGSVTADGTDVTIQKSIIRDGGNLKLTTKNSGTITITDSEIDGNGGDGGIAVGYSNITMNGVWLHDIVDGVRLGPNIRIVDSLISDNHDDAAGHHPDSTQTTGTSGASIEHSTILAFRSGKGTQANSGVEIGSETGSVNNLTIRDSFIDGGNYGILMQTPGKGDCLNPMTNVKIINNTFGGGHRFGPLAIPKASTVPGFVVTGNKMADGSAVKVKTW